MYEQTKKIYQKDEIGLTAVFFGLLLQKISFSTISSDHEDETFTGKLNIMSSFFHIVEAIARKDLMQLPCIIRRLCC